MFRLSLIANGQSGTLKAKEKELDYPHSLLLHDKHAANNLFYTINTIRTKNVKGSYIITMSKVLDIGGLSSQKLTKKYDGVTVTTFDDDSIYLTTQKHLRFLWTAVVGNTAKRFKLDKINPHPNLIPDTQSLQHIHLGRQILINGTKEKESKPEMMKKPFPSLLLEKDGIGFTLEYLDKQSDGNDFTTDNEEIDIYGTIYKN